MRKRNFRFFLKDIVHSFIQKVRAPEYHLSQCQQSAKSVNDIWYQCQHIYLICTNDLGVCLNPSLQNQATHYDDNHDDIDRVVFLQSRF